MKTKKINKKRKKALKSLWKKYTGKFKSHGQNEIFKRGFILPKLRKKLKKKQILVVGLNPSINPEKERFSYKPTKVGDNDFFDKLKDTLPKKAAKKLNYLDLFYSQHHSLDELERFAETDKGREFMQEQLALTRKTMEKLKPSTIVVFNKQSWKFWGKDYDTEGAGQDFAWLGYTYDESKNGTHIITGLVDKGNRVKGKKKTKLKGARVYFSKYLPTMTDEERNKVSADLKGLV